ncbi:hypothetical protein ACFVFH_05025 [Streptomyces sp. NPDC057697]|uniref:hypothetical protein n=1 Tax=Streptomyces sp. NPDC057697 TaxID=3346219 RepID=UPI00369995AD
MITPEERASGSPGLAGKTVYLCGDVSRIDAGRLREADRVFVVRELARGHREGAGEPCSVVGADRVPLWVHGVGVYYRRFFPLDADHFGWIGAEHAFQSLTESTKPGTARRSGIQRCGPGSNCTAVGLHPPRCFRTSERPPQRSRLCPKSQ